MEKKARLRRLHAERGGFGSFAAMNAGMGFACVPFKVACFFSGTTIIVAEYDDGPGGFCQLHLKGMVFMAQDLYAWNSKNKMQQNNLSSNCFTFLSSIPTSPPKHFQPKNRALLLMEEIRLTSWHGKYPIIYRVSAINLGIVWFLVGDAMMEPFQLSSCLHCIVLRKLSINPRFWNGSSSELHVAWYDWFSRLSVVELSYIIELYLDWYQSDWQLGLWRVFLIQIPSYDIWSWDMFLSALWRMELVGVQVGEHLRIRAGLKKFHWIKFWISKYRMLSQCGWCWDVHLVNLINLFIIIYIGVVPPPRMPVANEGLGWDPRSLKM